MTSTYDQARRLRELMRDARVPQRSTESRPSIVAVVGGCAADKASLIAVELAEELGRQAVKVKLNAVKNVSQNGKTPSPSPLSADGGGGFGIDAGARDEIGTADVELELIDASAGFPVESASTWHQVDLVLLVFSASRESLIASYSWLKSALADHPLLPVWLVPSQCSDGQAAQELHERISACCERYLGQAIQAAPWLPTWITDSTVPDSSEQLRRLAEFVRCRVPMPVVGQVVALTG